MWSKTTGNLKKKKLLYPFFLSILKTDNAIISKPRANKGDKLLITLKSLGINVTLLVKSDDSN